MFAGRLRDAVADLALIDEPGWVPGKRRTAKLFGERVKDWWRNDLYTRRQAGRAVDSQIQTRWREDDLGGWLLDEATRGGGNQWEIPKSASGS